MCVYLIMLSTSVIIVGNSKLKIKESLISVVLNNVRAMNTD